MDLANCYRLLGLTYGASLAEVKASYRRLARRYHPDVNSGDKLTQEKFIQLTEAYKLLLSVINSSVGSAAVSSTAQTATATSASQDGRVSQRSPSATKVTRKPPSVQYPYTPSLSEIDKQLKWNAYEQLQQMLKSRRFARAIALVEGLAQRIPHDLEVRQWQAIAYSSWGRHLVNEGQLEKARIYLKKALRTDPQNRSLWAEVERDFRRIEEML
jgi:tetratricopeptide (TPR) repeat protein